MIGRVLRRLPRAVAVGARHSRTAVRAVAAATAARSGTAACVTTAAATAPRVPVASAAAWRRGLATSAVTRAAVTPASTTAAAPAEPIQQSLPVEADDTSVAITRKFTHATVSEPSIHTGGDYTLPHPIWKADYLETIQVTHVKPKTMLDTVAYWTIQIMRKNFDLMSGYALTTRRSEALWLNRIIFLESVAGVPGSIGGTVRHLASLRRLRRDHGWIHTLLEEAENERMHLLTAIQLRQPGPLFRAAIFLTQGIFFNFYWVSYLLSPKFCHRIVGYLEEEAVKTYTQLLRDIDNREVWHNTPAPEIARLYWRLPASATMRDVIANIRADETHHRDVNHRFADLKADARNPYPPGH